jgi:hypothetical protein
MRCQLAFSNPPIGPATFTNFHTAAMTSARVPSLTEIMSARGGSTLNRSGEWFTWRMIRQLTLTSPRRSTSKPSRGGCRVCGCHCGSAEPGEFGSPRQRCPRGRSALHDCQTRRRPSGGKWITFDVSCQGERCQTAISEFSARTHVEQTTVDSQHPSGDPLARFQINIRLCLHRHVTAGLLRLCLDLPWLVMGSVRDKHPQGALDLESQ